MLQKLHNWWKRLFSKEKAYRYIFIDDVPDRLNNKVIYLITHQDQCWQIVMICPCGCGKLLHMNVIKDYHPCWKYEFDSHKRISLQPSIHRQVGCKSHFFIRNGKVNWCR